jgi:uncharacterized protein YdbL (DUF1318 family)
MKCLRFVLVACILALIHEAVVAQSSGESRKQIESRLELRYPQVLAVKTDGRIGETWQGFIDVVPGSGDADAALKSLVDQENADRRALYAVIAAETTADKVRVTADEVGQQSGGRSYRRAKPVEYFMTRDGTWIQRNDADELKAEGKIGETWQGRVEAVKPEFASDRKVAAVVTTENQLRSEQHAQQARKQGTTSDKIGEQQGERTWSALPKGFWFKQRDGTWVQK